MHQPYIMSYSAFPNVYVCVCGCICVHLCVCGGTEISMMLGKCMTWCEIVVGYWECVSLMPDV